MAILLPNGKQAFSGVLGLPLVGGRVYTYAAGTNTPQATWVDANKTVPNTNPVILDARGEASIFWEGAYKVVLRDALDNLIWTQDNVTTVDPLVAQFGAFQAALASATNPALLGFRQAGKGAILRTLQDKARETVSFKDFGAIGDGTNHTVAEWIIPGALGRYANLAALQVDYPHVTATTQSIDWAAIQAALANASATGQVNIEGGKGHYIVSDPLTATGLRGLNLEGEGWGLDAAETSNTILEYTKATGSLLAFDSCAGLRVCGIVFKYSNAVYSDELVTTDNTGGLDTTNFEFNFCVFQGDSPAVNNAAALLRLKKSIIGKVRSCVFKYSRFAIALYSYVNVFNIDDCTFLGMVTKNIYMYTGTNETISVTRCTFEPTLSGKAHGFETAPGQSVKGFIYERNWHGDITAPGGFWVLIEDSTGVSIRQNLFGTSGGGVSDYAIYIGDCSGWEISANTFYDKAINFTSANTGGVVMANAFTVAPDMILDRALAGSDSTWTSNSGLDGYGRSKAYLTASQAAPNTTFTAISFGANFYDVGGVHSTAVNPTRFTVPAGNAGLWQFHAVAKFAAGTAGSQYILQIRKNGSAVIANIAGPLSTAVLVQPEINAEDMAADGDYYELLVWQNSGGSMNIAGSVGLAVDTYMAANRV